MELGTLGILLSVAAIFFSLWSMQRDYKLKILSAWNDGKKAGFDEGWSKGWDDCWDDCAATAPVPFRQGPHKTFQTPKKLSTAIMVGLLILLTPLAASAQSEDAKAILAELARLRADVTSLRTDFDKLEGRVSDLETMRNAEQSRRDAEQADLARKPVPEVKQPLTAQQPTMRTVVDQWGRVFQVPVNGQATQQSVIPQQQFIMSQPQMQQPSMGGGMMRMSAPTMMRSSGGGGRRAGGC